MIEGDPIQASKLRNKKKNNEFIDYFLSKDDDASFTNRKFNEIQKVKQRKKKIKKRIIQKKQKASAANKRKLNINAKFHSLWFSSLFIFYKLKISIFLT